MAEVLSKIYAITAYFDIALIAALATVYAIIVSLMSRMLAWVREKLREIELREGEAEERFRAEMDSVKGKKPQEIIDKLTEKWEASKAELAKTKKTFKRRERLLSWGGVIVFTGGLLVISLTLTLVAIPISESSPLCSAGFYMVAVAVLLWALFRIALTLKEATELAKETTPQEKQELEKLFKEVFGLKKPEFAVHFVVNEKLADVITIEKDQEQWVTIQVDNNSHFAVQEARIELALPDVFTLRKNLEDTPDIRSATFNLYPSGATLVVRLEAFMSKIAYSIPFLIKGKKYKKGGYDMYVWIGSTSHVHSQYKLKVKVKK